MAHLALPPTAVVAAATGGCGCFYGGHEQQQEQQDNSVRVENFSAQFDIVHLAYGAYKHVNSNTSGIRGFRIRTGSKFLTDRQVVAAAVVFPLHPTIPFLSYPLSSTLVHPSFWSAAVCPNRRQ